MGINSTQGIKGYPVTYISRTEKNTKGGGLTWLIFHRLPLRDGLMHRHLCCFFQFLCISTHFQYDLRHKGMQWCHAAIIGMQRFLCCQGLLWHLGCSKNHMPTCPQRHLTWATKMQRRKLHILTILTVPIWNPGNHCITVVAWVMDWVTKNLKIRKESSIF
jgi:hypothetical protein